MLNLNQLNDAQREAVMHGKGALLVLAGPGSGKTFTITQRIFYLLEKENVSPEKILVITFTKEAALSMQRRFIQMSNQTLPVNFGTFHSVFYHIIQESHILKNPHILTDAEKKKLMIPIVKKYGSQEPMDDAVSLLSAISYQKNTGNSEKAEKLLWEEWRELFPQIRKEYDAKRKELHTLDFDDMVYECYQFLQGNENARAYWQNRFSHILIDEFQDINPMQYQVIRLLSSADCNLFAVGDDDQSIYSFRGAKPEILKQFQQDYKAKTLCLNVNYRSCQEIITASLSVINENKNRFFKPLKACTPKEKESGDSLALTLRSFAEREQQYEYLVSRLRHAPSDISIGVLFRTNAYMQGLAAKLSREGIAYTMKEKVRSIYDHFIVKDIISYLRGATGKGSRADFLRIMNRPFRQISREAVGEVGYQYREMISFYRQQGMNVYHIGVIKHIEQMEKQMECIKRLSPFPAVQYIRKAVGYEKYLKGKAENKEQWLEWEELLEWLSTDASHYQTLDEWMEAQEQYNRKMEQNQQTYSVGEGINLITVHGAKGLEYDTVCIPDCNEKIYPHGAMSDEESCEEERRIFYVGMTRAKKNLELLYLTGTKERPRFPSRFLNPLLKDYSSTNSSNSQLSRYSSKASATRSYSSSSSMYPNSGSSLGSSGFSL